MTKILVVLLTIPIFISLMRSGFYPMQDDLQAFRVHQMFKCLQDLQIPCRWIPDMGYQYGYPQFNFYPPSIYYFAAFLHLFSIQIIDTVKILFILGSIISTITMFIFLKALLKDSFSSLVGSLLYSYIPYKAVEIYVRGSLSEFWAYAFFPLIFWSSFQLISKGKLRYISWFGLSLALLLITHNLMSFIFFPLVGVWSLTLMTVLKKWSILPKLILGAFLGLGLAGFFILPVVFEGKYVHLETLLGGYFDYRQHFVNLYQIFLSYNFGYGSSMLGPNDDLSLSTGIIHWVLGALALILAAVYFKKDKTLSIITFSLGILTLVTLFMMHEKSSFIWERIPPLFYLQFPWRFLSDSTFLLSILGGIAIYRLGKIQSKLGLGLGVLAIIILFTMYAPFFKPKSWLKINDSDKFSNQSWEKQLTISIFDYLPIFAKLPPNKKAPQLPEVLDGDVKFISYKKGSNYQIGEVEVGEKATLRLPLFDFPGMEVKVDNQKIEHIHTDCRMEEYCLGLITFRVLEGKHKIEARLENTPIRTLGNIITVVSFFALVSIFILGKNEKYNPA